MRCPGCESARAARDRSDLDAVARVPTTVQDVLAARVDRLPEEPRRVLQTASVLGREFPLRLLERVWDGPAPVGPQLAELTRLEFIHELQGVDDRAFVFKHALTQDVAYDGLLTSLRKRLHEAAGAALEELYEGRLEEAYDRLAHHYSQTDRSDKAVHYLDRFAERAVRTYAHAEAAKALREALVHVERLPAGERERRAVDLVLRLVNSLYFLGRFGESLDLLQHQEPAVERIDDPWLSGPFSMWLGHTYTHAGDSEGAARSIARAIAEAEPVGDRATIGKSHYVMAREGFWLGDLAGGAEHGRRAVGALSGTGDWWWLAHSYCWTGLNLCNLGRFEEALAEVARARAIGEERADPRIHSYSSWNAGWIQATRGEWEAAIADCTESLETSPDSLNSSYSMGWLGFSYREKGDMGEAIRYLEQSIALLTEFRYSRLVAWFTGWLSEAHLSNGDLDQALTAADQALRVARELRYPWGMATARRALGRIALARGALGEAERHLGEALASLEGMGARFDAACVVLTLAEVAAERGDAGLAGSCVGRCLADFDELRTPRWTDRALRLARGLGLEAQAAERPLGHDGRGPASVALRRRRRRPRAARPRAAAARPLARAGRKGPRDRRGHGTPAPAPPRRRRRDGDRSRPGRARRGAAALSLRPPGRRRGGGAALRRRRVRLGRRGARPVHGGRSGRRAARGPARAEAGWAAARAGARAQPPPARRQGPGPGEPALGRACRRLPARPADAGAGRRRGLRAHRREPPSRRPRGPPGRPGAGVTALDAGPFGDDDRGAGCPSA